MPLVIIVSFKTYPLRGRPTYLYVRKRKWLEKQTGEIFVTTEAFKTLGQKVQLRKCSRSSRDTNQIDEALVLENLPSSNDKSAAHSRRPEATESLDK